MHLPAPATQRFTHRFSSTCQWRRFRSEIGPVAKSGIEAGADDILIAISDFCETIPEGVPHDVVAGKRSFCPPAGDYAMSRMGTGC